MGRVRLGGRREACSLGARDGWIGGRVMLPGRAFSMSGDAEWRRVLHLEAGEEGGADGHYGPGGDRRGSAGTMDPGERLTRRQDAVE